ncbi:MAG: hypothetical protein ABSA59_10815 [Terriglobia bacterium]
MTSTLESLVRFAGGGLFVIYASGFIILSVYESKFGVAQFNPLRTKIIAAGLLFFCLIFLPILALYAEFGAPSPEKTLSAEELRHQETWGMALFCISLNSSIILALFCKLFLFTPDSGPLPPRPDWLFNFVILAVAFHVKSSRVVISQFRKWPGRVGLLACLSTGVMAAGLYWLDSGIVVGMAVWFLGVAFSLGAVWSHGDKIRYVFNWRRWLIPLILILIYPLGIYPRIEARYGGGAPVPVTLCLEKPPLWIGSTTVSASILDETDLGFYLLLPGNEKALFIPRSIVVSIYFDSKEPHILRK